VEEASESRMSVWMIVQCSLNVGLAGLQSIQHEQALPVQLLAKEWLRE
jgi:hypothetical protein